MWGRKMSDTIKVIDQEGLAEIVREAGYKALVKSRAEGGEKYKGEEYIETAQSGWKTFITFFNKTEDGKYTSFQFGLWMNNDKGEFSLTKVNEFNANWRYAKITINDDNSLLLRMDVNLVGGVSREHIIAQVALWDNLLSNYGDFAREFQKEVVAAREAEEEKTQQLH